MKKDLYKIKNILYDILRKKNDRSKKWRGVKREEDRL